MDHRHDLLFQTVPELLWPLSCFQAFPRTLLDHIPRVIPTDPNAKLSYTLATRDWIKCH